MSGLLLNCLLPFVRPTQSVSVDEVKNVPLNQFLDKTFSAATSIVNDQSTRQGLVTVFESHVEREGSAPSVHQLFNMAREACAVDADKDVITWLETLLTATDKHRPDKHPSHGHQEPPTPETPTPKPVPKPQEPNQGGGSGGNQIFVTPAFFPSEQSFNNLVKTLESAEESLDICVFTITDDALANAIRRASNRGVRVRIITDNDKAEDLGSDAVRLNREQNIEVRYDASPAHMHHKFAIVDNKLLVNGSYNWTKGARFDNRENLTLTNAPKAIHGFKEEFERMWDEFGC
ncbi:hypothetical protein BGZ73_002660 [Actinomortierella ambigua]|nr:hypothetical protein BGZ73_002660 [Actinomortierella ambigua]